MITTVTSKCLTTPILLWKMQWIRTETAFADTGLVQMTFEPETEPAESRKNYCNLDMWISDFQEQSGA